MTKPNPLHRHPRPVKAASVSPTIRLGLVLALTLFYAVAELAGGLLSNSLALLADAGHMTADCVAIGLALFASWFARRPPDPDRTYGYQRAEILAALANGVALCVLCLFLFWEAMQRLKAPLSIHVDLMAWVATGGLVVNVAGAVILHGRQHGMSVRSAFLHVMGDLLGSLGTLLAAALLSLFGWTWADPAASLLIGGLIVFASIRLVLDSVNVLMEGTPSHLDTGEIRDCLLSTDGVGAVHDLHVWTLGGGNPLLTVHLVADHSVPAARVLRTATEALRDRFGIIHATLQVEPPDFNIVHGIETSRGANRSVAPPAAEPDPSCH